MMKEITVKEFVQEVKDMVMEVMPKEFEGVMTALSKVRIGYNEEEKELIFYTGNYNYGGNASMMVKADVIKTIYKDEYGYHFTLNDNVTFSVSETPGINGNLNDLLDKPSHHQCELARVLMKSNVTDKQIIDDLLSMKKSVWYIICENLDETLKEHSDAFDRGHNQMIRDFRKVADMNQVDEASVYIAYMSWKNKNKETAN